MAVTKSKKTVSKAAAGKPAAAKAPYAKKSRKWLVIGIIAVVALAIPLVYGAAKYRNKLRDNVWKADGIAASRAGDHDRAADLLGRYVNRHPRDVEAIKVYITSREQ